MGLLSSRSCPFVVGCQERASSLYSFKEWARGRVGKGSCVSKRLPLPFLPDPGLVRSGAPRCEGTVLLYLKCFLTSFPAPGRGSASPSWGGPMFLLPTLPHWPSRAARVPNCCLPPPSFTLTSFSSSQCSCLQSLPCFPFLSRF